MRQTFAGAGVSGGFEPGADTAIFLSYGQQEMKNHSANHWIISAVAGELYVKGVNLTLRIVRDGYHCEAAWEKEVPIFMDSLEL